MNYIFDEKVCTPLCEIMGRNGSDKGHININKAHHNYTTFYYSIFKDLQYRPLRIFELGLGTHNPNIPSNMSWISDGRPGASLYGWAEFFINAQVFGADIDPDILFYTDRISTFYCDQTNPHIIKYMWNDPRLHENFDIIVEDGLHTFDANVCFFENSIHKLKPDGYYITEDIVNSNRHLYEKKIMDWEKKYTNLTFNLLTLPFQSNNSDNTLMIVRKH